MRAPNAVNTRQRIAVEFTWQQKRIDASPDKLPLIFTPAAPTYSWAIFAVPLWSLHANQQTVGPNQIIGIPSLLPELHFLPLMFFAIADRGSQ